MMPVVVALYATIAVLLAMVYFQLTSLAFLLVTLDIPPVAQLFRGLFNGYFLWMTIAGAIGTVAFAAAGRGFRGPGAPLVSAADRRRA